MALTINQIFCVIARVNQLCCYLVLLAVAFFTSIVKMATGLDVSLTIRIIPLERDDFLCDRIYFCVKIADSTILEHQWRTIYTILLVFSYEMWLSQFVYLMFPFFDWYLSILLVASTAMVVVYAVMEVLFLSSEANSWYKGLFYFHIGLNICMLVIDGVSSIALLYTSFGHCSLLVYFNDGVGTVLVLLKLLFRVFMITKYWQNRESDCKVRDGGSKCVMEAIELVSVKFSVCLSEKDPSGDAVLVVTRTPFPLHFDGYTLGSSSDLSYSKIKTEFVG